MARTTENLIEELAQEAKPVKRIASPRKVAFAILAGTVFVHSVLLLVSGIQSPQRPWIALLLLAGGALFAVFAARTGVPGQRTLRVGLAATVVAILSGSLLAGVEFAPETLSPMLRFGMSCFAFSIVASLLPLAAFFTYLKRGHVLRPRRACVFAGASASLLALGALEFHCPVIEATHLSFGHLAPMLLVLGAGALIFSRVARPSE